jgi:hypothetical protein
VVLNKRSDGKRTEVRLTVEDAETLSRVDAGELVEFSPAYDVEYDPTPGVTPEGERYDGTQTKRVYNHIAMLGRNEARGGREMALRLDSAAAICDAPADASVAQNVITPHTPKAMSVRFDGKEYDSEAQALGAANAALDKARADEKAAKVESEKDKARADEKDEELKRASDPKRIQALVDARVRLDSAARTVCGAAYDPAGKSERQVMLDVIRADVKDFKDEDANGKPRTEEYLRARFDGVCDRGVRADGVSNIPAAIAEARADAAVDEADFPDADAAQAKLRADMSGAWKPKAVSN